MTDQRLIEDYIPIEAISNEARREKSIRKGHISTLHLWWARRPLVACRAAVYGALVPAPATPRARRQRADFVAELCTYPGPADKIAEARRHILEAHAARLSEETGQPVTVADIEAGRAPRPRVLDMFAGGGAIPLEALRLGCEAYALELNPVAHLIELCTLVYPQQYGQPNSEERGARSDGTWAGLAQEVEYWGKWVLKRVKAEIGDLYPPIPDPQAPTESLIPSPQPYFDAPGFETAQPELKKPGRTLTPIAYLWTRTVRCKNPACGATVPLARQTWLAKKKNRYVALKPEVSPLPQMGERAGVRAEKCVRYRVVEAATEKALGFDPAAGSRGGNVACPFCGTVVDSAYVRAEGQASRIGVQPMAVVCTRAREQGKVYISADELSPMLLPDDEAIRRRIETLCLETGLQTPSEPIEANPRSMDVQYYGLKKWADLFTVRQLLALLTFVKHIRMAQKEMLEHAYEMERAKVVVTYLGMVQSRLTDFTNSLCTLLSGGGRGVKQLFVRQSLPMVWDFAETNPLNPVAASWNSMLNTMVLALHRLDLKSCPGQVTRASATEIPFGNEMFDAIITDPPYSIPSPIR